MVPPRTPHSPPPGRRPITVTGRVHVDLRLEASRGWPWLVDCIRDAPPGTVVSLHVGDLAVVDVTILDPRVPGLVAEAILKSGCDIEVIGLPGAVGTWVRYLRRSTWPFPPTGRRRHLAVVGGGAA